MTSFLKPCPKPTRESTDYQAKSIEVAGKIACIDGRCAMCGKIGEIYPHHIVHRKYGNTCALVENLLPVCVPCHSTIHHNETAFKEWLEKRSPGLYDRLWQIARDICRLDWFEVYETLLGQYYKKLKEKAAEEK